MHLNAFAYKTAYIRILTSPAKTYGYIFSHVLFAIFDDF